MEKVQCRIMSADVSDSSEATSRSSVGVTMFDLRVSRVAALTPAAMISSSLASGAGFNTGALMASAIASTVEGGTAGGTARSYSSSAPRVSK